MTIEPIRDHNVAWQLLLDADRGQSVTSCVDQLSVILSGMVLSACAPTSDRLCPLTKLTSPLKVPPLESQGCTLSIAETNRVVTLAAALPLCLRPMRGTVFLVLWPSLIFCRPLAWPHDLELFVVITVREVNCIPRQNGQQDQGRLGSD